MALTKCLPTTVYIVTSHIINTYQIEHKGSLHKNCVKTLPTLLLPKLKLDGVVTFTVLISMASVYTAHLTPQYENFKSTSLNRRNSHWMNIYHNSEFYILIILLPT